MTDRPRYGVFVAEGTSDMPISDIVEDLFFERGTAVHLSKPDFNRLEKVSKDVRSRLLAGRTLADNQSTSSWYTATPTTPGRRRDEEKLKRP